MVTRVELRMVAESDLDIFDAEFQSEAGASEYQWFGYTPTQGLREALRSRTLLGGADNMLTVTADGEVAGRVEWLERRWGDVIPPCAGRSPSASGPVTAVAVSAERRNSFWSRISSHTPGSSGYRPPPTPRTRPNSPA